MRVSLFFVCTTPHDLFHQPPRLLDACVSASVFSFFFVSHSLPATCSARSPKTFCVTPKPKKGVCEGSPHFRPARAVGRGCGWPHHRRDGDRYNRRKIIERDGRTASLNNKLCWLVMLSNVATFLVAVAQASVCIGKRSDKRDPDQERIRA